ncbi:MAG: response regulator [Ignavibacteriaceae bacterium]|nr:response regulator [Ignavibacterium sp.]MCC6253379.1 response regulator [Ignavibacteriaceae bacterium]HRN26524.1 ATP-binding protein [Ignavibacteriaceae bacterium]HRP92192.1 ATP-binding protein [Ignavibacteriaceae bacterium]HRQ54093.1 ATP-binding protein [Ignavibacteriaceae bacterium]
MSDELIRKYKSKDLLELQTTSVALADKSFKIYWFNKSFKKDIGSGKIKGVSLKSLFNINTPDEKVLAKSAKSFVVPLADKNKNIIITPLFAKSKKEIDTYFIELLPLVDSDFKQSAEKEKVRRNLVFQNELQSILVLLVKEKSVENIAEEILIRCIDITKSDFGVIAFQQAEEVKNFIYFDNNNTIPNRNEVEKSIKFNSSFINKWLEINKRPLLALSHHNNIGFGLTQVLNCESLCISPCYFDNILHAKILVGKKSGTFSSLDISDIEQFSILLSFAISNIETRELNAALESRLLQSQKLETIGKLSSGMAHDFNNLLSSIFGSLHLLRNRVPSTENVIRLIDNIENCSVRARDLTKGLLSFGKPTAKRKEIVMPNFLLSEIVKIVTQTFPSNIILEEKIDSGLHNIIGNGTEIYQILLNLCVNAKESIEGKGKIVLRASNLLVDDTNIINYPLLDRGKYVKFSVSDTGTGINEEDISKIFDPYFSTKQKDTGSGLGLYVSYGIIKAHKGHIDVTSRKGMGTTFDVYLPVFEPQKDAKPKETDKIIMLADDEEMLSELLAEMLEASGYYVIKVKSGKEVITVLTEELKVDLLIIDYNMPVMNGLECVSKIRSLSFNLPVILSSGSMGFNDEDLKHYNISSKIMKPYEFDTMLDTIKQLI